MVAHCEGLDDNAPVMFHPLCGGIHPDLAWKSLRLFADEVLAAPAPSKGLIGDSVYNPPFPPLPPLP